MYTTFGCVYADKFDDSYFRFPLLGRFRPRIDEESLLFHALRDSNVIIVNNGKTAHRPK